MWGWRVGNKERERGGTVKHLENYCSLRLLLLQCQDESSAGCLGDGYFPPPADQFHLHKCPMKLWAAKIIYPSHRKSCQRRSAFQLFWARLYVSLTSVLEPGPIPIHSHRHTHTNTHTHTNAHTDTYTNAHRHTHKCTHTEMDTETYTEMHAQMHTNAHTYTHMHTHSVMGQGRGTGERRLSSALS